MVNHNQSLYDAAGVRAAAWSCDPTANGFQTTNDYVLGAGGEQVTEMAVGANNALTWQHTNVWAGGKLLATYDANGLHYYSDDPLGTRRAQTDMSGVLEQTCNSLPFGDGESCPPTPTEHLFTGKERDSESGNDYFDARYYSSAMGRFLSPDWSAKEDPIPYAKMDDPQTLNLYAYVGNNPMTRVDADGHAFGLDDFIGAAGGALVGAGIETGKELFSGETLSGAKIGGAAAGGAVEGWALVNAPETLGASLAVGGASGAVGNLVEQGINNATGAQKGIDGGKLAISTALGAASAGIASRVPGLKINGVSAGRGNMKAVAQGVRTKIAKGIASSMSLRTAARGTLGRETGSALRTAAETATGSVLETGASIVGGFMVKPPPPPKPPGVPPGY